MPAIVYSLPVSFHLLSPVRTALLCKSEAMDIPCYVPLSTLKLTNHRGNLLELNCLSVLAINKILVSYQLRTS